MGKQVSKVPRLIGPVNQMLYAFWTIYTSPAWGSDRRTKAGAAQKDRALRKAFARVYAKMARRHRLALISARIDYEDAVREHDRVAEKAHNQEIERLRRIISAQFGEIIRLRVEDSQRALFMSTEQWQSFHREREEVDAHRAALEEALRRANWELHLWEDEVISLPPGKRRICKGCPLVVAPPVKLNLEQRRTIRAEAWATICVNIRRREYKNVAWILLRSIFMWEKQETFSERFLKEFKYVSNIVQERAELKHEQQSKT